MTDDWSLTVTQVDSSQHTSQVPSTARLVIEGDTITWHISMAEFVGFTLHMRASAFGHDGSFSASDRGGDVSGEDPTINPMAFW